MQCLKCGYMLTDFDTECPRCANLAAMPWVAPEDALHPRINARPGSRKSRSRPRINALPRLRINAHPWLRKDLWIGGVAIVCILASAVVIALKIQGNDPSLNWRMQLNHIEARAKLQAERAKAEAKRQAMQARIEAERARVKAEQQRQEQEADRQRAGMRDLVVRYLEHVNRCEAQCRLFYKEKSPETKTPATILTQVQLSSSPFEIMMAQMQSLTVPEPCRLFHEAYLALLTMERNYLQALAKVVREESDLQRLREAIITMTRELERMVPELEKDANQKLTELCRQFHVPKIG